MIKCRMCGSEVKTWKGLSQHVRLVHRISAYAYMSLNLDQLRTRITQGIRKAPPPVGREHLGECWVWKGRPAGTRTSYGSIRLAGSPTEAAHRVSFWAFTGRLLKITELILHQCDESMCVRPEHLKAGDHRENMIERNTRCRQSRGAGHHNATLTEEDVQRIRQHRTWGAFVNLHRC